MEIPVYLFTGFLESGKTKFIQGTLGDERFNGGESTLLLMCEEGIEEYDPKASYMDNVYIHSIEDPSEMSMESLTALQKKYNVQRVMIEYNGMWQLDEFYQAMPENWAIYQEIMFCDASTFINYNNNMRSLVVDKLTSCELVVFNRYDSSIDKMLLHKIVRTTNRRCQILYEYRDGSVDQDDIEDPLPFDVNAPVIEIADQDYALWYRDITENQDKYDGKTVKFKALVATDPKLPKDCFVPGRHIMTCCEADITFSGLLAQWEKASILKKRDWVIITVKIEIKYHKIYKSKGPILHVLSLERTSQPENPVATFY